MLKIRNGVHLRVMEIVNKERVEFRDLGIMEYQAAWDYQEGLLQENVKKKAEVRTMMSEAGNHDIDVDNLPETRHYLLFVEHPPVYTLGKSGDSENLLINNEELGARGIEFFRTNRGGDITFHGKEQIVGYPILDLEKFYTDIGKYLRSL